MLPGPGPRAILDIGCGPGAQTLVLARHTEAAIMAVDIHQPYLDRLNAAALRESLSHRVQTRCVSMEALDYTSASFDLIWAEGAAYFMGLASAIRCWRRFVVAGGCIVLTEATWLTSERSAEAVNFWMRAYPSMASIEENVARARAEGLTVLDWFVLPEQDWWRDYLDPLERRISFLSGQVGEVPGLLEVMEEARAEIAICRRHLGLFGYAFFLLRL